MAQRRYNLLLLIASIIGGILASYTGEIVLASGQGKIPNVLLIGIYFGQFALIVGFLCLIAELISPVVNGKNWRNRYAGAAWKWLFPGTFVLLFLVGFVFQFLYGLNIGNTKPPEDILMLMDVSESMKETDPNRQSIQAAKTLIEKMDAQKRAAVLIFNDRADIVQPLTGVDKQLAKDSMIQKLDSLGMPQGGTNIGIALETAMKHMEEANSEKRKSMLIVISDGYSEMNVATSLAPYKKNGVIINTVGMNAKLDPRGAELLQAIALETGGSYYNVNNAQDVSSVFEKIYYEQQDRHLVGERMGHTKDSVYYAVLRILFLIGIGACIGLSLGIVFDNRYLARSFFLGGLIAGLLAGGILEVGLGNPSISDYVSRFSANVVLAVVLTLSTVLIPIQNTNSTQEQNRFYKGRNSSTATIEKGKSNSQGF